MGWLIAREQARFFLRLFSRFLTLGHFPEHRTLRATLRHPFSLGSSPSPLVLAPLSALHSLRDALTSRHARIEMLSLNYTYIPPHRVHLPPSYKAFNAPIIQRRANIEGIYNICMYMYPAAVPLDSPRWRLYITPRVRLHYEKELNGSKRSDGDQRNYDRLKGLS